ncbi:hypothetical protein Q4543_17660 [Salipiger sp. 1_MG-2023]|uniref:spike base protein, RCAP_Rcc01079 family n=1 Tax=Salipiger sp. 1_MG-2023 TaxID=3062665 RepID=UPI0026E18D0C|nr:hypothetical protein [Salipiger sp. 1_MG-2023]MDO6587342.1 hypothetical protein [Salipiger sp. 1_MG-2023]
MADTFQGMTGGMTGPATHAASVTPSDSTDLSAVSRAIMVGVSGDVAVITQGGETVTLPSLQAGLPYAVRVSRILSTGTTATGIVALW